MKSITAKLSLLAIILWVVFAASPRYQTGQQVFNASPSQNTTTGVLTLPETPRVGTVRLYVNALRHKPVEDFTISGTVITPVAENVDLYKDSVTVFVVDYVK